MATKYWVASNPNSQIDDTKAQKLKTMSAATGESWTATHSGGEAATAQAHYSGGGMFKLVVSISALADTETVTVNTPIGFRVHDVKLWTSTHAASATIQVKNGGTALSNTLASTDHTIVHATTLDDAQDNFAAGDNDLVFIAASGSGDWSGMLYLECIQV